MAPSDNGDVKPMSIAGRTARERERLIGMTDAERAWRAKFVKSQELASDEPIQIENYYKECYNPLRRFYRAPLNKVEGLLAPVVGTTAASVIRFTTAKIIMGIFGIYCACYYFKYNTQTWMSKTGWRITVTHGAILPGDPPEKIPIFGANGFDKSPI